MENYFMKFYSENNISPVRQDISNKKVHLYRREKLYRQLGIPVKTYRMADMLEVGRGL